jgi:acyl-CoA thioester hydrolase
MVSYRSEIRVRYAETDQMGVVHHATYPIWFEAARSDLFRAMSLPYSEFEANGVIILVTKMTCRFLKPAHYDELIEVEATPCLLTPVRLTVEYQVTRSGDGALLATGSTRHAFANPQGRPINLKKTPFWRKLAEALPDIIATTQKKAADER